MCYFKNRKRFITITKYTHTTDMKFKETFINNLKIWRKKKFTTVLISYKLSIFCTSEEILALLKAKTSFNLKFMTAGQNPSQGHTFGATLVTLKKKNNSQHTVV